MIGQKKRAKGKGRKRGDKWHQWVSNRNSNREQQLQRTVSGQIDKQTINTNTHTNTAKDCLKIGVMHRQCARYSQANGNTSAKECAEICPVHSGQRRRGREQRRWMEEWMNEALLCKWAPERQSGWAREAQKAVLVVFLSLCLANSQDTIGAVKWFSQVKEQMCSVTRQQTSSSSTLHKTVC